MLSINDVYLQISSTEATAWRNKIRVFGHFR